MIDNRVQMVDLTKRHGETLAVDSVSLDIPAGEFFSLLGPSGSGKTTLLRLLAGLDQPDRGTIMIQGRSMAGEPPQRRPVNMVFQQYALFPHLTVFQNVAFGLEMQNLKPWEVRKRVGEILELVKLSGKEERMPAALSGGEQQRVALARALVNRPAVLLLDEPLGALDQQLRVAMQGELRAIQAHLGMTFINVTHHQEEALTMSHRIAVMDKGRVLQVGSPHDLYRWPATPVVAGFIGRSNRVNGTIVEADGGVAMLETEGLPLLEVPRQVGFRGQDSVTLIVRPEWIHVTRRPYDDASENHLPARIRTVQYLGNEFQYDCEITPAMTWTVTMPISSGHHEPFGQDEPVFLHWKASDGVVLVVPDS